MAEYSWDAHIKNRREEDDGRGKKRKVSGVGGLQLEATIFQ